MNYIFSLKQKKKRYLTSDEKKILSEVDRYETLLRVYEQRLEFLNFSSDFYKHHKNSKDRNIHKEEVRRCEDRIIIIKKKLEEFNNQK